MLITSVQYAGPVSWVTKPWTVNSWELMMNLTHRLDQFLDHIT